MQLHATTYTLSIHVHSCRLTVTSDLELQNIVKTIETYAHRKDRLHRRVKYPLPDGSV